MGAREQFQLYRTNFNTTKPMHRLDRPVNTTLMVRTEITTPALAIT